MLNGVVPRLLPALVILLVTVPALGQLTAAHIEALRQQGQREGWTFEVGPNGATDRPLSQLAGAVEPLGWEAGAKFDPSLPERDFPTAWSWYYAGVTPIRDQGACGSCWAFGAIGAFECGIRIRGGGGQDLSEQWLVSCTTAGTCSGGWHTTSFEYLMPNGRQDPCGGSGAVMEASFPYKASDLPCGCPYTHPYPLHTWAVVGQPGQIASVEQIKQAVLDHGPVATCVYVNSAFQSYRRGVFNACEDQWVNHVVVIIGWDDTKGANGAWRIRNSWGIGWGEGGYMWIEYGCSRIGYATCWVEWDWKDCNGNGIHDRIDIRRGLSADINHNYIPDECEALRGDVNCDGAVDFGDVNPFVLALSNPAAYAQLYPDCLFENRDINGDGVCSFDDINAFVELLTSP